MKSGARKGNPFEEGQLLVADRQARQVFQLFADGRQVQAQVFLVAAAELPLHLGVGIVVQHRLHHGQLVEVGIQQVLHDTFGKSALGHARLTTAFQRAVYWRRLPADIGSRPEGCGMGRQRRRTALLSLSAVSDQCAFAACVTPGGASGLATRV